MLFQVARINVSNGCFCNVKAQSQYSPLAPLLNPSPQFCAFMSRIIMGSCFLLILRGKMKCEDYTTLRVEIKYLVSMYNGPFL